MVRDSSNKFKNQSDSPKIMSIRIYLLGSLSRYQLSSEMEDIDKRELNLVILGLPERDEESEDPNDLIQYIKSNCGI